MPQPVILFREGLGERGEFEEMARHFEWFTCRSHIPDNALVIGRYSVLPYYDELEMDLASKGSHLINSPTQHHYIADLGNWYRDLQDLTPKTWGFADDIPLDDAPNGFVLKGETNSKKFLWDTHMFAPNIRAAVDVMCNLQNDGLIGDQRIYYRAFEKLKTYLIGFRGMPVTHEFRVFVCDGEILTKAFYWSNYWDDISMSQYAEWGLPPDEFINEVIKRVGKNARFYVVDVALREDGKWIVIELNDGQMSGLSMTKPKELYAKLQNLLED